MSRYKNRSKKYGKTYPLARREAFIRLSKMRDNLDQTYYSGAMYMTQLEEEAFLASSDCLHNLSRIMGKLAINFSKK